MAKQPSDEWIYTIAQFVTPFLTLRELCASPVRVCRAWTHAIYADARWCVISVEDLDIRGEKALASLVLRPLPTTHTLYLKSVYIPDITEETFVRVMSQCTALKSLNFPGSQKDEQMAKHLNTAAIKQHLKGLTSLDFNKLSLIYSISTLQQLPNVQHVKLNQLYEIREQLDAFWALFPPGKLLSIDVDYASFLTTERLVQILTTHRFLEVLCARASGFLDSTSELLGPCLKELNIHGCMDITDTTLFNIAAKCPNLTKFEMGGATHKKGAVYTQDKVTDAGLLALSNLPHLSSLGIFHCHTFSMSALVQFARKRSNTLHRLNIGGLHFNDSDLLNIAKSAPNIVKLYLEGSSKFTLIGLVVAAQHMRNLEKIYAFGCKGLREYPAVKVMWGWNIRSLSFYACDNLSDEAFGSILEMCGKTLEKLTITSTRLSDEAFWAMSRSCSRLRHLDGNFLTASDESVAAAILSNRNTLRYVDLEYNKNGPLTLATKQQCPRLVTFL